MHAAAARVLLLTAEPRPTLLLPLLRDNTRRAPRRTPALPPPTQLYQFTSAKKMASVLLRRPDHLLLLNKGAAEWVLRVCDYVAAADGTASPLDEAGRAALMEVVVGMASRGLRCIALTSRRLPLVDASRPADFFDDSANLDCCLTVEAIVGIKDPVR